MKRLTLLLIGAALSGNAFGTTWVQVKGHAIAYDKDSIVHDGDKVKYWLKTLGDGAQNLWPKEMDCKNRVDKADEHFWIYDDGRRIKNNQWYTKIERIAPGSELEALHGAICSKPWEFWKRW